MKYKAVTTPKTMLKKLKKVLFSNSFLTRIVWYRQNIFAIANVRVVDADIAGVISPPANCLENSIIEKREIGNTNVSQLSFTFDWFADKRFKDSLNRRTDRVSIETMRL